MALLQYQRESFVRKVCDVDPAGAARAAVASGTSLLWLTNHMADAEITWLLSRFAGSAATEHDEHASTIAGAVARYRHVWVAADRVVAGSSLDAACPPFDDAGDVDLRWIVAHLLEETARHAGHADIIRELLDGTTGR